ncbi:hypothetical protein D3C81_622630 [compost metagenome]
MTSGIVATYILITASLAGNARRVIVLPNTRSDCMIKFTADINTRLHQEPELEAAH